MTTFPSPLETEKIPKGHRSDVQGTAMEANNITYTTQKHKQTITSVQAEDTASDDDIPLKDFRQM